MNNPDKTKIPTHVMESDSSGRSNALLEFYMSLRYFLTHYRRRTLAVFAASLCLVVLDTLSAAMLMPLLSITTGSNADNRLLEIVETVFGAFGLTLDFYTTFLVFIGAFVARALAEMGLGIFVDYSKVLIERDFRSKIIDGLKRVSWDYFTRKPQGLIVNLMTQEINRAVSIFTMLQTVSTAGIMTVAYLLLGLSVSPEMLIGAAVIGAAGILVARPMFQMARRAGVGQIEHMRDIATDLLQGMQAYKAFKAMAREHRLLESLVTSNDWFMRANQLKVRAQRFLTASQQIVFAGGAVAGVYIGRDILGMGLAEIGFIGLVLMRSNAILATMLKKFQGIAQMYYSLERFDEFHSEIVGNVEIFPGQKSPDFPSSIRFEDVSFRYGSRPILRGVTLEIPPTGLTCIMGPSGSGKTTIIDLLCGFYSPRSGKITIGRHEIQKIKIREWRNMIGYVTQEPNLLNASIRQNVAAFDSEITDAKIARALKLAGAGDFISIMEEGLDASAGEGGAQLSGGEKQRIAIARALALEPRLLILDEPTAAVDSATEKELVSTINDLKKSIPIIVISHQPAFAKAADSLFRIDAGRIKIVRSQGEK